MPNYRRAHLPGGSYFFTVVTHGRAPFLCIPLARRCLRRTIRLTQHRWTFSVDAFVLLPDHFHTIWTLPQDDSDFSKRVGFFKKEFTKMWLESGGSESTRSDSQLEHRRKGVWQRRFWEHAIRDESDYIKHVEYIHYNPVKHGLADCPHAWPYSSFHRFAKEGTIPLNWGCSCEHEQRPPDFRCIEKTVGE